MDHSKLGLGLRILAALTLTLAAPLAAAGFERTEDRAPCADNNPQRNPYFGDLHVHTTYSPDASVFAVSTTPRDAYAFAKGAPVGLPPFDISGNPMRSTQLSRPLDFAAVTDHAEFFGEMDICLNQPGLAGYSAPLCSVVRGDRARLGNPATPNTPGALPASFSGLLVNVVLANPARPKDICGDDLSDCAARAPVIWQDSQAAAEEAYDRSEACTFTSLVGYEWTANTGGANLHRNVLFRNAAVPSVPITYFEANKAQYLWNALQTQCKDGIAGCDVLAIPHNSNISTGLMFNPVNADGSPLTAADAQFRSAMEPLVEITQSKGSSECRPGVLSTDEQCGFESMNRTTLNGPLDPNVQFAAASFVRNALKEGLHQEQKIGANPFQLGFIGSTDTHNSNPGDVDEFTFGTRGAGGGLDSTPAQMLTPSGPGGVEANAGGLAVLWSEENSRDALFEAMRRRETYSTSGPRIVLRSFAGRYDESLCDNPDFVAEGYGKGVPMGGEIGPVRGKFSPRFAIMATKDAGTVDHPGTPLQRIQVIKGWIDSDSPETHEEVYDVAGDPDNGAGVDLDTCAETGTGATSLCTVWQDPHFKADQKAFYYVRVLENPVCRWSKRLCNNLRTCSVPLQACSGNPNRTCTTDADCSNNNSGTTCSLPYTAICTTNADCQNIGAGTCGAAPAVNCSTPGATPFAATECCDSNVPSTIQERAIASPIWYHPELLGVSKGSVKFGKVIGEDRLQLALMIPHAPAALDPAVNDLVLTLSDQATEWTATIPAGTMEVKKPGASYSYKDKSGAISGITGVTIKIVKGGAKIAVKTGGIDLSGLTHTSQTLTVQLATGAYNSLAASEWGFKDPTLAIKY